MERGLYEQLITRALAGQLAGVSDLIPTMPVDVGDQPHVLARHVESAVHRMLAATSDPRRRLELVNTLLEALAEAEDEVPEPARQLHAVLPAPGPGVETYDDIRPATPLSEAALLTNTRGEPNLGSEIKAELGTADEVDLLCAFVKWYGLRLLEPELRRLRARGAPFRVITTTYIGATDPNALDRLVRDFGAEVKISYDSQRTRLHAKAWMFRRATTFDTAYVGSSNLSRAALLDGVEWNVRLSRVGTPALLEKFRATFDTYWNDPSFEPYDPDRDRDRLDDALAEASGQRMHERVTLSLSGLEVRPFPYQQTMLDALDVERRVHDRHRNLLVAATGTGKTVVAALDYRRLSDGTSERPSLLFVAHRREILEQSLRTYREVLNDANFGELYVGGTRPERWRHVFASVQSLTAYGVDRIDPAAYDIVVIDEFHHAEAATYRRLLDRLEPRELLGLTATPERTDGLDVRSFFAGRTAAELRLWDALGADLLCPFHYFAIADGTDLRQISWSRGRYDDAELSGVYTGNRARAAIVLDQLRNLVLDLGAMRALGFCVSVAHATFMAQVFREAGIARARRQRGHGGPRACPGSAGSSSPPNQRALRRRPVQRRARCARCRHRAVPPTDGERDAVPATARPRAAADSRQGGADGARLRRAPPQGVPVRPSAARPDRRHPARLGARHRAGFPFLPSGCQIVMDRQSQHIVLENIRSQVGNRWPQMVSELRSYGEQDLRLS